MQKENSSAQGFSLLELLVALGILLILTGFVINAFTSGLRSLRRESNLALRDADLKRALDLLTVEIGQAGTTPEITDPFINPIAVNNGDCDDRDGRGRDGRGGGRDDDGRSRDGRSRDGRSRDGRSRDGRSDDRSRDGRSDDRDRDDDDGGDGGGGGGGDCEGSAKLSLLSSAGITDITLNSLSGDSARATRGLYPGRPLVLGLPEGSVNSEAVKIGNINGNLVTLPGLVPAPGILPGGITTIPHTMELKNLSVTSPQLPNMYGILNPPPSPASPFKTIAPDPTNVANRPVRLGIIGDILGDGNLYYVEFTYDYQQSALSPTGTIGTLLRSITPINPAVNPLVNVKAKAFPILENATSVRFDIIYKSASVPIPVSVRVTVSAQTSVPEPQIVGGAAQFRQVTGSTEIMPRGTAAAALIFVKGGERQLRAMMPPCNANSSKPEGAGFYPCALWAGWQWWQNVLNNYAGKNPVTGLPQALP